MTAGEQAMTEERAGARAGGEHEPEQAAQAESGEGAEETARRADADADAGGADGERWPDRRVLTGPFTLRQLRRLDEALRTADTSTGLQFSVYVGELSEPYREHAEQLHRQLSRPAESVLVAVAPNQRVLEIVTGAQARHRLPDRDCKLAALSMTTAFSGGDLAGGIVTGLAQLANRARG